MIGAGDQTRRGEGDMSERSAEGDLGRGLTGEVGEDDTVRLRAGARTALALCVCVFASSALFLLLAV